MIPKKIHYCWFGGNPLPDSAIKCINSWKKYLPEYQIIEWNENNFELNCCSYVKEAAHCKKWAYVSDYARFKVLYDEGGLYFDTDVEIIKPLDSILENGQFMGIEKYNNIYNVAAGLGIAANAHHPIYKEILIDYENSHFTDSNGNPIYITVVKRVTDILKRHGFQNKNIKQEIDGITIYPSEYFCPLDYETGDLSITDPTKTIHWYSSSWFDDKYLHRRKRSIQIKKKYGKIIGPLFSLIYMKVSGIICRIIK